MDEDLWGRVACGLEVLRPRGLEGCGGKTGCGLGLRGHKEKG